MKQFDKKKILNRMIYFILILLIILSSAYIVKSFVSKIEATKEKELLNSVTVDEVTENKGENIGNSEKNGQNVGEKSKEENNKEK